MKKLLGLFLTVIGVVLLSFSAAAGWCDSFKGSNENAQNYTVWADTVKSYLHSLDDGSLMRVQYVSDENLLHIEYYSNTFERTDSRTLALKYPVFGGFYASGDAYFILSGQNNLSESDSAVCFAVTKYDKSWKELATAQLKNCNTIVPFKAGSARFAHSGNYLIIRTCHQMYRADDGYNHQANVTLQLDMNTMNITDSHTSVASSNYGYVSHSFNQFVRIHDDKIVALDHGDAYPRSIVLLKYKTSVSSGKFVPSYYKPCTAVDMLQISGTVGDNSTGCSVGGFEISSTGYLACFNSIRQGSASSIRDIYISYASHSGTSAEIKRLTSYDSAGVSTPQLVKINDSRFMVLWSYDGRVNYCTVDGEGNLTSDIMSFKASLSDCQPVVSGDSVIWYVWNNERVTFYTVGISDASRNGEKTFKSGHSYAVSGVNGSKVELKCSRCGEKVSGNIPSHFQLYWETSSSDDGMSISFSSQPASSYHPNKTIRLMVKYTSADINDFKVYSSDEGVAEIISDGEEVVLRTVGEGSAVITVCSKYNPEIKTQYTVKVAHNWKVTNEVKGSCTADGKTDKICTDCSAEETKTMPAAGHKMSAYVTVKEATCKAVGEKVSSCSQCDYKEYEELPKKDHDNKITIDSVAPTCTKQGKTAGKKCSVCGKITVEQESIPALGHELGEYKITKKPTCTAQGEETAQCVRCSYTKTQSVARIAHTEVAIKATSPTCTKQGKTAGKKCSVCDKITVEQESIPALGHELGEYKITKKPTCTAQGEETAQCIRCSHTKTQSVAKIAHTEVAIKATSPTCTKQGKTAGKKCYVCDKITVEQESIPALGHELGEYKITKKPTCTAQGEETAQCIRCSHTKTQSVAKIAHTEVAIKATSPTCTKQGKTAGKKCSVCDKITVEQESIPALGHELGEYETTKEATCSAKGEKTASCIRCSYSKTADIPKLEHAEKTLKAVKATCTKAGKTQGKKCSLCGKTLVAQESVAATGHSKKTVVLTKATTKANGRTETNCETCGKSFGENRVYRIQSVTLSKTKYTCDGKVKSPKVTVTDYNKDQLIKDRDYTVTYQKGRKAVGKYAVTVKFKGKYSGKVTLYFEIKLAKVAKLTATAGTKSVSLKWDAVKGADGYQVYYSEKENGSYKKLTGTKKTSIKNTQLKSGKKYYFKVRAYKKTDSGTVYGSFSQIKTAKIK